MLADSQYPLCLGRLVVYLLKQTVKQAECDSTGRCMFEQVVFSVSSECLLTVFPFRLKRVPLSGARVRSTKDGE